MEFSAINWWAVLTCVLANMVIGGTWFSPKTFFSAWWKAIGKPDNEQPGGDNMGAMWGGTVLASFVQSVFMYLMVNAMGSMSDSGATWRSGALTGFFIWFGFIAPSSLTNKLFAGQFKAWLYEVGNHLVTSVVLGAIAGGWR